jgi:hypothetical protein
MRTNVHISFDSDDIPGGAQVVLEQAQCGPDVAGIDEKPAIRRTWAEATLEENDPRLRVLLDLLKQHHVDWSEDHHDDYTEEDLDRASLLMMHPTQVIMIRAGVDYGTTYDLTGTCPACGTSAKQTSSLFIDAEDLHYFEGQRAVTTDCAYILVDAKLEADLVRTGATGMFFRDVYAVGPRYRSRKIPFRQLCATKTLAPVSPSTTGLRLDRPCKVCWRNGCCGDSLEPYRPIYRAVDLEGIDDVNMSWENIYPAQLEPELKDSFLSYPSWMVVSPKVFRVFRDADVTCVAWAPARVEEGPSISPEERQRYIIEHADTLVLPPMVMEDDEAPAESDEAPETPEPSADGSAPTRGFMAEPVMQGFKQRYEALQDKPTEEELDRARLLLFDALWHDKIPGGVPYGTTYDLSSACPACSSGARQTSSAFVDGEKLDILQGYRVGMTSARQCLVDSGLAKALEREGISGLSFRDVFAVMLDGSHVELPWKQISPARTLPPMAPSTSGVSRSEDGCARCHRDGYGIDLEQPMRIVYRHADLRDIDDVNLTWENMGRGVLKSDLRDGAVPKPMLLVTPKVRRIFLAAGASSFYFRPIRVEEG